MDDLPKKYGDNIISGNVERSFNNISFQTGEEFSEMFVQDRSGFRLTRMESDKKRAGNHRYPNVNERLKTKPLVEFESDNRTVVVDDVFQFPKANVVENEKRISNVRTSSDTTVASSLTSSVSPLKGCSPYRHQRSETLDSTQFGKMKFLGSFGGKILPRPSDGRLRYVGGETRIISIRKNISWHGLVQKTHDIWNHPHTIRYQLPGEDLDALISVSSDEDLQNMIEEYHALEKLDGSPRLRIFLVSFNDLEESTTSTYDARSLMTTNSDYNYNYVVAVNGASDPSPRKSSSTGNNSPLNSDGSPILHHDSPNSDGSCSRFFVQRGCSSSQFTAATSQINELTLPSSSHSPTFSPNNSHYQLEDDNLRHQRLRGGDDHFDNYLGRDSKQCQYQMSPQAHGLYNFHHQQAIERLKNPSSLLLSNATDFSAYSFHENQTPDKPIPSENLKHKETSESKNMVADSHHGIPHALSDSMLQGQVEEKGKSVCSQHGQAGLSESVLFRQKSCECKIQVVAAATGTTDPEQHSRYNKQQLNISLGRLGFGKTNDEFFTPSQNTDANYQYEYNNPGITVSITDNIQSISLKNGAEKEAFNTPREHEQVHTVECNSFINHPFKENYEIETSAAALPTISFFKTSPETSVLNQQQIDGKQHEAKNGKPIFPFSDINLGFTSANFKQDDLSDWSLFPNQPKNKNLLEVISLIDQDPIIHHDLTNKKMDGEGDLYQLPKLADKVSVNAPIPDPMMNDLVNIEDIVTDDAPSKIPDFPAIVADILHKASHECQNGNTSLSKITETESNVEDSECEVYILYINSLYKMKF